MSVVKDDTFLTGPSVELMEEMLQRRINITAMLTNFQVCFVSHGHGTARLRF